jgi:tetratricopeptide (TPR) repeat protein
LQSQGKIYQDRRDYKEALKLYSRSLTISRELGDKRTIGKNLHSIAMIYRDQENYGKAIESYNQALKIREEIGDKIEIAGILNNIGGIQRKRKEYALSLQAYLKAFSISKEINSPQFQVIEKNISYLRGELGDKEFDAILRKVRAEND